MAPALPQWMRPARGDRGPDAPPGPSFIHVMPDGHADLTAINEQAALRCALSRLCGHCAQSQGFPLVFVAPPAEVDAGLLRRPGMHEACARSALRSYLAADLIDVPWILLATGSFTIDRPRHRDHHEQVRFRPGTPLWTETAELTGS